MNKPLLSLAAICLLMSACSAGVGTGGSGISVGLGLGGMIGNHVGVGTSINIPIGKHQPAPPAQNPNTTMIEPPIITYFDAQGNTTHHAAKGGYSRQLLAKQGADYLVQDFYSTGEKRTDPMKLTHEQIFDFRAHPNDSSYTVYAINGHIMQQQNFRNGQLLR